MRVTDPRAIRALAHPLRLDLIEALTVLGPSTAAACARHLGSTQALCSFHLRQLAKYGFVEQAGSADRRERPWQLTDLEQSWSGAGAEHLDRVFLQREADKLLAWVDRPKTQEWQDAAFVSGATLPVTPDELDAIAEQLRAVLRPYLDRLGTKPARGRRPVRFLLAGTPQEETDA